MGHNHISTLVVQKNKNSVKLENMAFKIVFTTTKFCFWFPQKSSLIVITKPLAKLWVNLFKGQKSGAERCLILMRDNASLNCLNCLRLHYKVDIEYRKPSFG